MTELMDRQGELQLKIDAVDGWDLERKIDVAADALRLPAYEADVSTLSGVSAGGRALPIVTH